MRFASSSLVVVALSSVAASAAAAEPAASPAAGSAASPAAEPKKEEVKNWDLALQGTIGFIPTRVTATSFAGNTGGSTAGGEGRVNTTGFPLRIAITVAAPYFGDGIPRAFAYAGLGYVFDHKGTATYGALHGGAADSGASIDRQWQLEFGLGGLFPFCRELSCADLRIILGGTFVHEKLGGFTSEGGASVTGEQNGWKSGLFISPTFAIPLCGDHCKRTSLRLVLGAVGRAFAGSSVYFASGSTNYGVGVDPHLELEVFAGLSLPFAEF